MATSTQPDADDLTPGTELGTDYNDDTLTVTDRGDGEITFDVNDGEFTETYSVEGVQTSLDDGILVVEHVPDDDHGTMDIIDASHEDYDDADLYIRFGDTPADERSYDNRNDRLEDGVSVYACERDAPGEDAPVGVDEAYYPKGTMIQTAFILMTRDTYLVTGEQVGTGADGEPLLRDVEAVAELSSPKGVGGFVVTED